MNRIIATLLTAWAFLLAESYPDRLSAASDDRAVGSARHNATGAAPIQAGASSQVRPRPCLPAALGEPPEWVGENLPFDKGEYFRVPPPDKNAAPIYLDALFEFSAELGLCFPEAERKPRIARAQARSKRFYPIYDRFQKDPASVTAAEIESALKEYDEGLAKIRLAQQRPQCVFETDIDPAALLAHVQAFRDVARMLELKTYRDVHVGNVAQAIDNVEILLRMSRDLQLRAGTIEHLVRSAIEAVCYDNMITSILGAEGLRSKDCDRLLDVLAAHRAAVHVDPILEGEKYDHLVWRKLLYQLKHKQLAARARELGMDDPAAQTSIDVLLAIVLDCDFCELRPVSEADMQGSIRQTLSQHIDKVARFNQLTKDFRAARDDQARSRIRRSLLRMVIQLLADPDQMTPEDYQQEIEVLNTRFRQMEQACALPYPARVRALRIFCSQWTEDAISSKKSKLLRIFRSDNHNFVEAVRRNALRHNATLCLIALARWQLDNPQVAPSDLGSIARSAGLPLVPTDTYSGLPLKLIVVNGQPMIYSVGPDGDDDQTRRIVAWEQIKTDMPPDGDLVFKSTRRR